MSQEDRPKFSHITVGQTTDGDLPLPDDEDVISIGAVGDSDFEAEAVGLTGSEAANATGSAEAATTATGSAEVTDSGAAGAATAVGQPVHRTVSTYKSKTATTNSKLSAEDADDDDLGAPMPLAQRIVLVGCAIGLIVVIAFLVWYWAIA